MNKFMIGCAVCAGIAQSLFGGAAVWLSGSGDLSDQSQWSNVREEGDQVSSSTICYFKKSTQGVSDYTLTLSQDFTMKMMILEGQEQPLHTTLALAPYTLYTTSEGDAIRLTSLGGSFTFQSGTLSSRINGKQTGGLLTWGDYCSGSRILLTGAQTILDMPVQLIDGNGSELVLTNGVTAIGGVSLTGGSDHKMLISGEGTKVVFDKLVDFNIGNEQNVSRRQAIQDGTQLQSNHVARVTDGACVTNVSSLRVGIWGHSNRLDVENGAHIYVTGEISVGGMNMYSSNNVLRIAGTGFIAPPNKRYQNAIYVGNNSQGSSCGNQLIYDGVDLKWGETWGFRVGDYRGWTEGWGEAASNNTVKILNSRMTILGGNGEYACEGFATGGGLNNGIIISNSVLLVGVDQTNAPMAGAQFQIGAGTKAHDNFLLIDDHSVVSNLSRSASTIGTKNSHGAHLDVRNGSSVYFQKDLKMGVNDSDTYSETTGARLSLQSGASLSLADETVLYMGNGLGARGGIHASNRVDVLDGSLLDVFRFRMYGCGNALLISNATVRARKEVGIPYSSSGSDNHSSSGYDNRLVFAGRAPRLVSDIAGGCRFNYRTHFHFQIPEGGYQTIPLEQTAPGFKIEFANFSSEEADLNMMTFDLSAFRFAGGVGPIVLMRASTEIKMPDAQLEKFRENLPRRTSLELSADKKELVLNVGTVDGTVLIFR